MKRPTILAILGLGIVCGFYFGVDHITERIVTPAASKPIRMFLREEDRGPNGERLASVCLRKSGGERKLVDLELRVAVSVDTVTCGHLEVEHSVAPLIVKQLLRDEGKSEISVEVDGSALYFQVIELIDKLRSSGADCIWLNTKEPILAPQCNAGSRPPSGDSSAIETLSSLGPVWLSCISLG